MKRIGLVCLMALGLGMAGCDVNEILDPPLAITFRSGVLSQYVMQVSNLSADKGIEVYVYVASADNSVRSGNVVVPANGVKEFGALEIDWKFKPGDQGFVCPVRERKKLFFRFLQDGRFEKWFGFNDIPEVDVAAQVRAKKEAEHAAWLRQTMTCMLSDGRSLYVAMTNANAGRAAVGLDVLWPKPQGALKERAKDKLKDWKSKLVRKLGKDRDEGSPVAKQDVAAKKFKTAGEYWGAIFSPYLSGLPLSVVSDAAVEDGGIPAESVRWSVLADWADDLADCVPVLISANFPCEKLRSFWDGQTAATEKIALSPVGVAKNEAFAVVYKDGVSRVFAADQAMLANIYRAAFNTCTNGYNRPLRYLTPDGVVNAAGLEK